MSANYGSHVRARMYDHTNGTLRNGVLLQPASTSRRWWARILDAVFVLVFTGVVIGIALALSAVGLISLDAATGVCLASYPLMALVFGALYGCTVSPGQALCGVVSLQADFGRRVGFWRGMGRYLAVAFFPITVLAVLWTFLDAPTFDSVPIKVFRRTPQAR